VTQFTESVARPDVVGPLLKLGSVDFDGGAAVAAREMMVVDLYVTAPVEAFATIGHDDVDFTALDELLQLGVDGRQCNLLAVSSNEPVQVLGAHESLDAIEGANHLTALNCISSDYHPSIVPIIELLSGMILIKVVGMIPARDGGGRCKGQRRTGPRLGRLVATATAFAVVALALSACNSSTPHAADGKVLAVGAENQYANVISQIGGRFVQTAAIMSNPSTDPHTFEVSTSVARTIASAQLVVQNGVGYDAFMNQLESASAKSSRDVIDVQTLLGLPLDTKNPHLWYNPVVMTKVAVKIETDLAKIAPQHASYFATRLRAFQVSMEHLDAAIKKFRHRFSGTAVATTEPVADYLLTALGLQNRTPFRFQADIMNGVDPSPEDIAFQQTLFKKHQVKVFCYNAQVSSTVTVAMRSLAASSGVPVVAVYETMPTPGFDYQTWMLAEINALTKALTTHTSTKEL
jgi:zinc/manganese transport system substrate-binding protein